MKLSAIILLLFLFSCGGSLSDEQRRQMREKMELNKIVRVTEAEITEAAFAKGRRIMDTLDSMKNDSTKLKAYLKANAARVHYIQPGKSNARALEQQLVDAYLADESGAMPDNVQEKRDARGNYDSLLYTKPVTKKLPDGSDRLDGIWNIWISKKELVLEIGKHKEY